MSGGSAVVARAAPESVAPARDPDPATVRVGPGSVRRPRHRRSRLGRRVAWSGLALVVLATPAAWAVAQSQGRGGHDPVATGAAVLPSVDSPAPTRSVACWDGTSAGSPRGCGTPHGRVGVATVFPALTRACRSGAATRAGAVEAYLCHGDGYVIRYTRWQAGFDRFTPLGRAGDATGDATGDSTGTRWVLAGGRFAGRTWTSTADVTDDIGAARPFRWTATYRAVPFSVEVLATDATARTAGVAAVRVSRPGHVGRAR